MHEVIQSALTFFHSLGYIGITVLMAMEASVFPVPSEAVVPPAGYLASLGQMNLILAFLACMLGIAIGSTFNYFIGKYIGRSVILKYGKYLLISHKTYERSETLFLKNSVLFTFLGRLIPGVRHLISIPAGMFGMPFGTFFVVTMAGSSIWVAFLLVLGYMFGQNQAVIMAFVLEFTWIIVGVSVLILAGLGTWYFYRKRTCQK